MSDWFLLAKDENTGIETWAKAEEDGLVVQTRQDMSHLLDANAAERNLAQNGWKGDYHGIARLPAAMVYDKNGYIAQALREQDEKAVTRFLNDSDNSKLRTKEGRV